MHLAFVISSLNSGGAERVLSELANHCISQGHRVSLITLADPATKPFHQLDLRIHLIQLNQSENQVSLFVRLRNILRRVFCLRRALKTLNPDVILSFVDVMNLTTLLAATSLNIPVVVSERTHPAYHKLPILSQRARKILYPKASRVVVQTDSAADYFKQLTNLTVIPNAVRKPSTKKPSASQTVQRIISVGRLCPFKGFDTLIDAFAHLYQTHPHLQLTIYGEGTERQNLQDRIESLYLQEKVFLPGVTRNIHQALLDADLFVFPSRYEGLPNALCEAMAVGLPVIASNCCGNVDIIRDRIDGRLFPVGNVAALTELMAELLKDSAQRARLAKQAQTVCDRFHPNRVFPLWDRVIDQALRRNI